MNKALNFNGFDPALMRFLSDLAANNDKAWFEAHRSDYQTHYMDAAKTFVVAMGERLDDIAPGLRAEPRLNGSIMRIHKDTRFSKDKTPYKTALHLMFCAGAGRATENPGFFIQIAAGHVGFAAGMFGFSPAQLNAYRAAVDDAASGGALQAAVDAACRHEGVALNDAHYKRVPRGFASDHPRADLLRHAGLYAHCEIDTPAEVTGPACVDYCLARFVELRPIYEWVHTHVASA